MDLSSRRRQVDRRGRGWPGLVRREEQDHPRSIGGDGLARLAEAPQSPRLWTHGLPRRFPRASVLPGVSLSGPRVERRMVVDRAAGIAIRTETDRTASVTLRTGSSPAASRSYARATDLAPWPVSWHLRMTHRGQAPPGYDTLGNFRLQSSEYPADHGLARREVYEGIASASALSPDSAAPADSSNTVVVSREGPSPPNRPNHQLPKNRFIVSVSE